MKLPAARYTKIILLPLEVRWLCRAILLVATGMLSLGLATNALAQAGGTVTHNPKQSGNVKQVELKLESATAKINEAGDEVTLNFKVKVESGDDTLLDDTALPKAKIRIRQSKSDDEGEGGSGEGGGGGSGGGGEDKKEEFDIDKPQPSGGGEDEGQKETFKFDDLPSCKYEVTIVTDLWGKEQESEPKKISASHSEGGEGGEENASVSVTYGLGKIRNGSGGVLKLQSNWPTAKLYSPRGLLVSLESQYVTRDAAGVFEQATTDDTVTTISDVVENQGYTIKFAARTAQGPKEFKTVRIDNPGATPVANAADQRLFQEERWSDGAFRYELPVSDGRYKVRLYFAELFHDQAGKGVFNVTAEGQNVLQNYDIFQAAGGKNAAKVEEVSATVEDGKLSLGFAPVTFGAHISAIKVVHDETAAIAGTPDGTLYQSARLGNFTWQTNLPNGNYDVSVLLAETVYNEPERRVFDIRAEGSAKYLEYDPYTVAGSNIAIAANFQASVNDGMLDVKFSSVRGGEPLVHAIVVRDAVNGNIVATVNAGGDAYTAADGTVFAADSGFTGGEKSYPGRVACAVDVGSDQAYTAADGTVFEPDFGFQGGRVFTGVFNRLRVTTQEGQANPRISIYSWVTDPRTGEFTECILSKAGGLRVEGKQEVWSQDRQSYDLIRTVRNSAGNLISKTVTTFEKKPFGFVRTKRVQDPDGAAITTTWTYEDGTGIPGDPSPAGYGLAKEMIRSDGYWEQYQYSPGQSKTITQFLDSALGNVAASRVETVTGRTSNPFETQIVMLEGKEVERRYLAKFDNGNESERWNITCRVPGAAWNAPGNLVSKTCRYSSNHPTPFLRGRVKWRIAANGVTTRYSYNQNGTDLVTTRDQGVDNGGAVTDGQRTVTTTNVSGNIIAEEIKDIASGLTVKSWTALVVDDLGRVTQKGYGDNTTETVSYAGSIPGCTACSGAGRGLVISETDREGVSTSYKYDLLGRRTETTRLGITERVALNAGGRVLKRERIGTDGSVIVLEELSYDTRGRLVQSKDALGYITAISYSSNGRIVTTTLPEGGLQVQTSYSDGQLQKISGSATMPVKYLYGAWEENGTSGEWEKTIKVDEIGSEMEWTKTYTDLAGHAIKTEYADGSFETRKFAGTGKLASETDPDGVTTLYAYNSQGDKNVTAIDLNENKIIDYGGTDQITQVVYEVANRSGVVVNRATTRLWTENGVDSSIVIAIGEKDGYGNQSWKTDAAGQVTATQRVLQGGGNWTVTTTRPDASQLVKTYQQARPTVETHKASTGTTLQSASYDYDAHGRMVAQIDIRNGTSNYTYDAKGQMLTKTEPSAGASVTRQNTQYQYDKEGRPVKTILADLSEVFSEYFPTGTLKKTYGSQMYPVEYTYDPQGRTKTMTTAGQAGTAVTTWNYDHQRGWLKSKRYADNKGPDYTYTAAGRLKTRSWARGITTTYNYAAADMIGIDYSDGTPDVAYVFNRRGLRAQVEDASGIRSLSYNAKGDIVAETYIAGLLNGLSLTTGYDNLLRRNALTVRNGSATLHDEAFAYGEASRLSAVTSGNNSVEYGYVSNSRLVGTMTFKHNGSTVMTTTKSYDFVNRLTETQSVVGTVPVSRHQYNYTSLNQRNQMHLVDGAYWVYQYNAKGEVISGARYDANGNPIAGQDFEYAFDDIGNRQIANIDGTTASTYTTNVLNQYTHIEGTGMASPVYDDDGNLIGDGNKQLIYNAENWLITVKDSGGTLIANYTYDDQGRRVRKTTTAQAPQGEQDRVYLWDGWNSLAEMNYFATTGVFSQPRFFVWGLDLSISVHGAGGVGGLLMNMDSTGVHFCVFDGNGNVVNLLEASTGEISASYEYDPFGNSTVVSGSYASKNNYRFGTKHFDSETSLYYYGYRFYSPVFGKWLSRDPSEEEGGINLLCFLLNNSICLYDALGLEPRLPKDTSGVWIGEKGKSNFFHNELMDDFPDGVPFVNDQPDFEANSKYVVELDEFSGDREKDKRAAIKKLGDSYEADNDHVWHHFDRDGKNEMQYAPKKAHEALAHDGPHKNASAAKKYAKGLKGAVKVTAVIGIIAALNDEEGTSVLVNYLKEPNEGKSFAVFFWLCENVHWSCAALWLENM